MSDDELKGVWSTLEKETSQAKDVLQLILLTGQRPGEIMGMRWNEIDFSAALWLIPGARTKNGLPNAVPLNSLALGILEKHRENLKMQREKRKERGDNAAESPFVFPNKRLAKHTKAPITHIRKATGRIWRILNIEPFCAHDLRRTCATRLGQMEVPGHVIARILNHKQTDITSAVYNQYQYLREKRDALNSWGKQLSRIVRDLELVKAENREG